MWYIYTVEYYSAIKKNEIMPFAATWMDLEIIILSKTLRERQISIDITYMWNLKKYKWNYLQNRNRLTDFKNKHGYQRGNTVAADKSGVWD